jgi:hypothetical protein
METDQVYQELWRERGRTVSREARKPKVHELYRYIYDRVHRVAIYFHLSLYAADKEVNFIPQTNTFMLLKETSVTDNHWSIREENQ